VNAAPQCPHNDQGRGLYGTLTARSHCGAPGRHDILLPLCAQQASRDAADHVGSALHLRAARRHFVAILFSAR
jgi:hypothetical protein